MLGRDSSGQEIQYKSFYMWLHAEHSRSTSWQQNTLIINTKSTVDLVNYSI